MRSTNNNIATSNEEDAMNRQLTQACFIVMAFALSALAGAHEDGDESGASLPPLILGVLNFPNSGSDEAQDAFERGVMLLHSFEFDDSRTAFLEAQEVDPGFEMAIWGEAMTLNHPLWNQQNREEALQVLAKLPPRGALDITAREQRFIDAVLLLYGEGSKPHRDFAYMDAMREIYIDYPDDLEAASFYGLSILGSVYERDFRVYMKAASILEEVFAKQPKHPGAAHYLIHSYDDQVHAPLGLRAARVYNEIAPAASHAQHMVSHIYSSLGQWDKVVTTNEKAVLVSAQSMIRAGKPVANRSKHALHWLQYALLQQGRLVDARDTMVMMRDDLALVVSVRQQRHNIYMRASYAAEDPVGGQILAPLESAELPLDDRAIDLFASAYRYAAIGDLESAQSALDSLRKTNSEARVLTAEEGLHEDDSATSEDGYNIATIIADELQALLLFRSGNTDDAIRLLGVAAARENSRPLEYGPPTIPKPCSELLGEMLLILDRPDEAMPHFQQVLQRNTGRTLSLLGLARAQEAAGDPTASETWQQVKANWQGDLKVLVNLQYVWLASPKA
jgi:tetratricopeptide (TPR) repeat protein